MNDPTNYLWFYEKDGEEAGPVSEGELLDLLKSGQVFPDTLLWTESMVDWQPALDLEPFRSGLREDGSVWTPAPRPWTRFWARRVDLIIYDVVALAVLFWIGNNGMEIDDSIGLFLMILFMILAETCLLVWMGTTFGKWLFNISLTRPGGERLSFNSALYRTFLLWLRGLGLGIPFINLAAMAIGLRNLTVNQESSWDRDAGTIILHRKVSLLRWVAAFLIIGTYFIGLTVMLWPEIEKKSLEMQKLETKVEQKV